jgi:hypothetical protein
VAKYLIPGGRVKILEDAPNHAGKEGKFIVAMPTEGIGEVDAPSSVLIEFDNDERCSIPLRFIEVIDTE